MTAGIISAKGRDLGGGAEHQFQRFIQTDAGVGYRFEPMMEPPTPVAPTTGGTRSEP